ncbi:MAG: hypothetical protein KIT11_09385 [Fimbriimonadaceae bacterium]|nr:hypothetical protein [Fimbriimonadaceae bacterium]QYK55540.1 MAG: hypothetical protein KF733_11055 [Fimbriimonadaceae bacterium]
MKAVFTLALFGFSALAICQEEGSYVRPSSASRQYNEYRKQLTEPLRHVAKIKALVARLKRNENDDLMLPDKVYNSLSVDEKFTFCMLHGEYFSQNCDAMPPIQDEDKKIFPFPPAAFGDEATWSQRQLDFMAKNRAKVVSLLRETIRARQRVGVNFKAAIDYLNAWELIPDLIAEYRRDRKDHDILTLLMLQMRKAEYEPFFYCEAYLALYGDDSGYQAFMPHTVPTEQEILRLARGFYESKKR